MEIEAELRALAESRVVDGDPATVEAELLEEQEEIELALGEDYLDRRDEWRRPRLPRALRPSRQGDCACNGGPCSAVWIGATIQRLYY